MRGPVPGVARKVFSTIIHWARRKRSHGSLGYLQHTLVLLERRRGRAPFAHHMHVLYYSHPRRYVGHSRKKVGGGGGGPGPTLGTLGAALAPPGPPLATLLVPFQSKA